MEREACVCDHGYERSDLCAEIIIIIIIIIMVPPKRFDISPPDCGGCSESLDAFRFFLKLFKEKSEHT